MTFAINMGRYAGSDTPRCPLGGERETVSGFQGALVSDCVTAEFGDYLLSACPCMGLSWR